MSQLANYSLQTPQGPISAAQIIDRLDATDPIQHAHIGQIYTLCWNRARYSNEDLDVLSAAWANLHIGPQPVPEHRAGWVTRWQNAPSHIIVAKAWAKAQLTQVTA
jgi:hypothetical protein